MISISKLPLNRALSELCRLQVRWKHYRKPIALGTAKSKLFIVPKRPVIPEEEEIELRRIHNNYRTQMKSVIAYLVDRYETLNNIQTDEQHMLNQLQKDFARCNEINEKWNAEQKVVREERYEKELQELLEEAQTKMNTMKKQLEEEQEQAEEDVRKQKQLVGTFITPEKLDEAIEYAINNPVDYNFAIDLQGNRTYGRETNASEVTQSSVEIKQ